MAKYLVGFGSIMEPRTAPVCAYAIEEPFSVSSGRVRGVAANAALAEHWSEFFRGPDWKLYLEEGGQHAFDLLTHMRTYSDYSPAPMDEDDFEAITEDILSRGGQRVDVTWKFQRGRSYPPSSRSGS